MELKFPIDHRSRVPIYVQIMNHVKHLIATGVLTPGQQLPTIRQLAVDITVNLCHARLCHGRWTALDGFRLGLGDRHRHHRAVPALHRCITCHSGTADATAKEAAHQGLISDPSETNPQDRLICHRSLPDVIPQNQLRAPHRRSYGLP